MSHEPLTYYLSFTKTATYDHLPEPIVVVDLIAHVLSPKRRPYRLTHRKHSILSRG